VGQRKEDGIEVVGQLRVDRLVRGREVRVDALDRVVVTTPARQPDEVDGRMARQQSHELGPDVPGRADDPHPDPLTGARPAVRRDRGPPLDGRAHGRAGPFAEGSRREWPGIGWTAVMDA
jgi:hypothetical protein